MNYDIYYNLLNLPKTATLNDIKKAYRQMSIKYHPDKNNSSDSNQFNKINEAYIQLTNHIDNIQNNNANIQNNNANIQNNNNEIILNNNSNNLSNINNSNNYTNLANFENSNCIISNYNDIVSNLNITYYEAYYGCNKPIIIERKISNNNIITYEKETLYISIPKGIDNNEIVIIHNKGNIYINNNNNYYSNIKIIVILNNHEIFERNGLDILYTKNISLKEALIGFSFNLNHINNKHYKITINEIIHFKYEKIIRNMGFMRDDFVGNLIIKFNIIFPKIISKENKEKLATIL